MLLLSEVKIKMRTRYRRRWIGCLFALASLARIADAQPFDPARYRELAWRMIGPFRGGRTVAGRVWVPIFDEQPTGSIGALAVAPSDANVVYVGSGEGLQRPDLSVGDG